MEVNFKIYENYAAQIDDSIFDLHNNFDFVGFKYDIILRQLVLSWKKNHGDWVPTNDPS